MQLKRKLSSYYVKTSEQYTKKLDAEFSNLNFPYKIEPVKHDMKLQIGPIISHPLYQQEIYLFSYRFNDLLSKCKYYFLHRNNLQYERMSVEEKKNLMDKLINSSFAVSTITLEDQDFYKVNALDLVRTRTVNLKGGYVYIPHKDIVTIGLNDFRIRLFCISHVLSFFFQLTARSLPAVHHGYVDQDYSIQKSIGNMSLEQIDPLSVKSYPLSVRQLHRMQYKLFLKGIGLTLDQALQFWRSEFVKGKVDAAKFDKAYAYSICHMFGKEGKRTDYTPYSCMKVILSNPPSQGDHDPELLKQKLWSYKVSPSGISQILEFRGNALTCQKYSELSHSIEDSGLSLNHPNQYCMESQKLLGGPVAGVKVEVKRQDNPPTRPLEVVAEMTKDLDSFFQDA
uniref:DNA primase subunit 2 n=1 Tax=Oncorhynchus tshawytscha TaxID=74940 RepID=A0AAZ3PVA2_ONCTS